MNGMEIKKRLSARNRKQWSIVAALALGVLFLSLLDLLIGPMRMTISECFDAFFGKGEPNRVWTIWNNRMPRVLAAIIAGAGLSVSGLIMQTCLNNSMASPSTLGVSNAAAFGANLSLIVFAGGFYSTGGNISNYMVGVNPYAASLMAFLFSMLSILLILGLCRLRAFRPGVVVLAGIAVGAIWTAATSVLQYYATDVGLSAAVVWSFGDLGRAVYRTDYIMGAVVGAGILFFLIMGWKLNGLLSGDATAKSLGINVDLLRFFSLLIASMITAICVSSLGVIGFIGIICPHVVKRLLGQDHRITIPASALAGSLLLLSADTVSRCIGKGSALPVGAITSMLGAPFFLAILFGRKEESV